MREVEGDRLRGDVDGRSSAPRLARSSGYFTGDRRFLDA